MISGLRIKKHMLLFNLAYCINVSQLMQLTLCNHLLLVFTPLIKIEEGIQFIKWKIALVSPVSVEYQALETQHVIGHITVYLVFMPSPQLSVIKVHFQSTRACVYIYHFIQRRFFHNKSIVKLPFMFNTYSINDHMHRYQNIPCVGNTQTCALFDVIQQLLILFIL